MPKILMYDGEWKLIKRYDEYRAMHMCEHGAFSWEKGGDGPQWVATGQIRIGSLLQHVCMGCKKSPPARMQGFINLLEWER